MTFFITTFILSGVGIAAILSRQALKIRKLSDRKLKSKVLLNADFFKKILEYYFVPIYNFWDMKIVPKIYHRGEKTTHRMRLYMLKAERKLLNFTYYIKGKREIKTNGTTSEFIRNLNDKIKK